MRKDTNPNRLAVWGHSMLLRLSGRSRTQRKREASKKRRAGLKRDLDLDRD